MKKTNNIQKTNTLVSIILLITLLTTALINAQTKYIDKVGVVTFEASEEVFEPVKATNTSVTAIFDSSTNQIASLALIKEFRFKNSLMEEHFNENYVESETYPKATFKGKLSDFNISDLTENMTEVMVDGKLQLNGKEKEIRTPLNIKKSGDTIVIQGSFNVTPVDFGIDIPKIVRNKIAKEVIVSLDFKLNRK